MRQVFDFHNDSEDGISTSDPTLSSFIPNADDYVWLAWSGETDEDGGLLDEMLPDSVTLDEAVRDVLYEDSYGFDVVTIVQRTWEPALGRDVIDRSDYFIRKDQIEALEAAVLDTFSEHA